MVTGRESRWTMLVLLVFGLFSWGTQLEIRHNIAAGQGSDREDGTLLVAVQRSCGIEDLIQGQADKEIKVKTFAQINEIE